MSTSQPTPSRTPAPVRSGTLAAPNGDRTAVTVRPIRFTSDLPRMRNFLALLGFAVRIRRTEVWATMIGAAGQIALHEFAGSGASAPGQTGLGFEVTDADALADRMVEHGLDAEVYDEAWGRVLRVGEPGRGLHIDEAPTDLYGYQVDDLRPAHGITAMPIQLDAPALPGGPGGPGGPLPRLLEAAGFTRLDEGDDEHWRVWAGSGGGLVAIHPPSDTAPVDSVRLGLRTREPLATLAARLRAAGHGDVAITETPWPELTVTDPDGQSVLVQPLAS